MFENNLRAQKHLESSTRKRSRTKTLKRKTYDISTRGS